MNDQYLTLDGYPLNMFNGPGWRVAADFTLSVMALITLVLAIAGIYLFGVYAIMRVAEWTGAGR